MVGVALFGGGGFIGSHLTEHLAANRYEVVVVDIESDRLPDRCLNRSNVEFLQLDITDPANETTIERVVREADIVIDLIAYANPQIYVDRPIEVVELNLFENLKVAEYCMDTDTRLVQFSTVEVYGMVGHRGGGFSEDESLLILGPIQKQRWIYSCAKQLLERMLYAYGEHGKLEYTIVRPFNFIGPKMDYLVESPEEGTPRVFANFMSSLIYGHEMVLVDGGTQRRSFTYIEDAVEAVELILENESGHFTNEIVNIGSPGNETTIRNLAHTMREIFSDRTGESDLPDLEEVAGEEYYGEGYQDSERRIPDIGKLEAVGWEPSYGLEETLRASMTYYIDQLAGLRGSETVTTD